MENGNIQSAIKLQTHETATVDGAFVAASMANEEQVSGEPAKKTRLKFWLGSVALMALVAAGVATTTLVLVPSAQEGAATPPPLAVAVSVPLERNIEPRLQFLGQFSAVDKVELRAQVGGRLTEIHFKDGDIVHKGDLLFVIDSVPYEIALSHATAQLETAHARLELANRELARAKTLSTTGAGTEQKVDQRAAEQRTAQAAVDDAEAMVRDAKFDLDHTRIVAPFTGRIGSHLVSAGNLIAGSRAASSPTTLLATIVSLETIYLNFDMSEADYMAFLRERQKQQGPLADKVEVSLSDETDFTRQGMLDFVDNALDRTSGTIHARATLRNSDLFLTPGGFARVRLALSAPAPTMLVPDVAVLPDQSQHVVLTLGANNTVTPKVVKVGDLRGGLRVITSGLEPSDKVIIDGIPLARPGSKVSPQAGSFRFESAQD